MRFEMRNNTLCCYTDDGKEFQPPPHYASIHVRNYDTGWEVEHCVMADSRSGEYEYLVTDADDLPADAEGAKTESGKCLQMGIFFLDRNGKVIPFNEEFCHWRTKVMQGQVFEAENNFSSLGPFTLAPAGPFLPWTTTDLKLKTAEEYANFAYPTSEQHYTVKFERSSVDDLPDPETVGAFLRAHFFFFSNLEVGPPTTAAIPNGWEVTYPVTTRPPTEVAT